MGAESSDDDMDVEHSGGASLARPSAVSARNPPRMLSSGGVRGNNGGSKRHRKTTIRDESSDSHNNSRRSVSNSRSSHSSSGSGRASGRHGTHSGGGRFSLNGDVVREDDAEYGYYNEPGVRNGREASDVPLTVVESDIKTSLISKGGGNGGNNRIDMGRRGRGGGGRRVRGVLPVPDDDDGINGVEDYNNFSDIPLTRVQRDLKAARASRGRGEGGRRSSGMDRRGGGSRGNINVNDSDDDFTKGQEPAAKSHGCMTTATAMKLVRPRKQHSMLPRTV